MSLIQFHVGLIVLLLLTYLVEARFVGRIDPAASHRMKALARLKIRLIAFAFVSAALWLSLPSTSALSTFGYPNIEQFEFSPDALETLDEDTQERLSEVRETATRRHIVTLLQDYNRAIVRTADVLRWTMFLAVGWLLRAIYEFAKAIADESPESELESPPTA